MMAEEATILTFSDETLNFLRGSLLSIATRRSRSGPRARPHQTPSGGGWRQDCACNAARAKGI
jgi:hypothetical protein